MMKTTILLSLALLSLVSSGQSFAAPYGQIISCSTTSNGLQFIGESLDSSIARSSAAGQCRNNSRTNNAECDANIICNDGSYSSPMISCSTSSNGLEFRDESRDPSVARTSVAGQCRNNSRTSNAECDANIICNDGSYSSPMISCSTSSNGLEFRDESRDPSVARTIVAGQCRDNSRTSNAECDANVICTDGQNSRPMISCTTFSRGVEFRDESRDASVARASVAGQCRNDSRTSNAECDANVMCNNGNSSYPQPTPSYPQDPTPPRYPQDPPRRETCVANRYDPAGMFVQSYRGQVCADAIKMCIAEIRGRQTCDIAR